METMEQEDLKILMKRFFRMRKAGRIGRIGLLLSAVMLVSVISACGSSEDQNDQTGQKDQKTDDAVYHVGICQLRKHTALDEATKGFQEALTEKLGGSVEFDCQTADGSMQDCQDILNGFVSDQVDLIMANATDALKAASQATNMIPIVATSITDYGTALNMREWTGTTGRNVTGTSDLAPVDRQAGMIPELFPDAKKAGILYCSAETNSIFQAQQMQSALADLDITAETYVAAGEDDIEKAAKEAAAACDVIYVPTDNVMASHVDLLKEILIPAGIPMIAGEEGICLAGVAALSISYYDIGYTAGEMAYEILAEGKAPGEMDIRYAQQVTKKYNAANCSALGIKVPQDYEAIE